MYTTCLFCHSSLGNNEAVEHFPVGRRLAFDAVKGRLWVVCRKCARWNLTPLEERWEAIEECERLFRDTKLRVSTDQIGLARLASGLELVRIGNPQRPEFAAWRYGDQFGRRRMKMFAVTGAAIGIGGVMFATGAFAFLKAALPGGVLLYQIPNFINIYRTHRHVVARVPDEATGQELIVRHRHALRTAIGWDEEADHWALRLPHDRGIARVSGSPALTAAGRILARLNQAGGSRGMVSTAVSRLEAAGGPEGYVEAVARRSRLDLATYPAWTFEQGARGSIPPSALYKLPRVERLALEMAANEEHERRALEGELAALEAEWREAEEIAAIADTLTLPREINERVDGLKISRASSRPS